MFELSVGRPYPAIVRKSNTVLHNFLTEHNTVVFVVSDMDDQKKHAMIHGEIEVGLLVKDNAIMFLWRFLVNNKKVVVMDGLFDALERQDPVLDDLHADLERLPVIFHIVNGSTNILEGVRVVTLPPCNYYKFPLCGSKSVIDQR